MEQKWVLIGDELRMDKVNSYNDLIGENKDSVRCYGTFKIDHNEKFVEFVLDPLLSNKSWHIDLVNVRIQGFYTPMIKDYKWVFDISSDFPRRSAMMS